MTIVVVGAGIIGCAIAHELASRGASVRVVDSRAAGDGATRASAGTLAPYIEGHSPALRALGVRGLQLFDGFIERVTAEAGVGVEYARTGSLQVALDDVEAADLAAAAALLAGEGVAHQWLDSAGVRDLEPALRDLPAALLIPAHGHLSVQALMEALRQAATRGGVAWTTAQVTGVGQSGAGAEVTTADTTFAADAVIIAAGSWSSELCTTAPPPSPAAQAAARQAPNYRTPGLPHPSTPAAESPVRPIRGQLVHLLLDHQPLARVVWGTGCYLVPWRDGSLLVGATVEDVGFDESTTPAAVRTLARAAAALVPAARGARIHDVRVGLRPKTPDGLPAIGRSSTMPSVFYATGHYRTGVLLAPLTAALIADLVLDRREDPALALVRPGRLGL